MSSTENYIVVCGFFTKDHQFFQAEVNCKMEGDMYDVKDKNFETGIKAFHDLYFHYIPIMEQKYNLNIVKPEKLILARRTKETVLENGEVVKFIFLQPPPPQKLEVIDVTEKSTNSSEKEEDV